MDNSTWEDLRSRRIEQPIAGSFEWMSRGEPHRLFFEHEPPGLWRLFTNEDRLDGYTTDGVHTEVKTMGECRMRTAQGHPVIPTKLSHMLHPVEAHLPLYALDVQATEIDGRESALVHCPVSIDFPQPVRLAFDLETGILVDLQIGQEIDHRVRRLETGIEIDAWECQEAPNAAPQLAIAWVSEEVPGIKVLAHTETYLGDHLVHTRTPDDLMSLDRIIDWARELADDVRIRPFGEAEYFSAGRKNPAGLKGYAQSGASQS